MGQARQTTPPEPPAGRGRLRALLATARRQRRMPSRTAQLGYMVYAVTLTLLVWWLHAGSLFLHALELDTLDVRYRVRPPIRQSPRLMTLDIDTAMVERAGAWPIPRRFYADFAQALARHDAALMVMDIVMPDPAPLAIAPDVLRRARALASAEPLDGAALRELVAGMGRGDDARLRDALAATGRTVLAQTFTPAEPAAFPTGADVARAAAAARRAMSPAQRQAADLGRAFAIPFDAEAPGHGRVPRARAVEPPAPIFLERALGLGFVQAVPDRDGSVRRYPLFMHYDGRLYPSLAMAAVLIDTGVAPADVRIVPGEHVRLPNARLRDARGAIRRRDLRIPVDDALAMMVNWAGDYLDTFTHVPATVLLRFRAIDLAREAFGAMRAAGTAPLDMDVTAVIATLTQRRLLEPEEAAGVVRDLFLTELAAAAMTPEGDGLPAWLDTVAAPDDRAARARLTDLWEQVAFNRRLLAALRDRPEAPYETLKAELAIPDRRDAVQRRAAERLRFLVRRGRAPASSEPLYFFPPVTIQSGGVARSLSPLDLADKIVFVGLTATGSHDYNPMPFNSRYPMVGLHVNAANGMLTDQHLNFLSDATVLAFALALALLVAAVVPRLHPFTGAGLFLVLLAAYPGVLRALFERQGVWLPVAAPLTAMTATYLGILIHALFIEIREKKQAREAYLTYRAQVENELRVARDIQDSALPRDFPAHETFDLAAAMDPAREVGGDLFDYFFIDDERLFFHVGDVSGKGIPAALFMMITQALVRSEARRGGSPGEVLARVNDHLAAENEAAMFVTMLCAVLNTRTGELALANAGHNMPLLRAGGGGPVYHDVAPGRILGILEEAVYPVLHMRLRPGDMLFLYTDGVTEAMDPEGRLFEEARLATALTAPPDTDMRGVLDRVRRAIAAFTRGAPVSDDVTMLALRYRGDGDTPWRPARALTPPDSDISARAA